MLIAAAIIRVPVRQAPSLIALRKSLDYFLAHSPLDGQLLGS